MMPIYLFFAAMILGSACSSGLPSIEGGDPSAHAAKASACICQCGEIKK